RAPQGPLAHAGTRGIPSDGRCRAGPLICLGRAGDACVVGALERVGDTLYGARVYGKLGRRLAHAHAARQSCSDSLSQLVRDPRPAESFIVEITRPVAVASCAECALSGRLRCWPPAYLCSWVWENRAAGRAVPLRI